MLRQRDQNQRRRIAIYGRVNTNYHEQLGYQAKINFLMNS
jgi:hypothetical protein